MIPDVTPNGVFYLPPTGWLTSFYNPPKNIYTLFFYFLLIFENKRLNLLVSNTTMPALSFKALDTFYVNFPEKLSEQKVIGSLLKKLDSLITLQQRKLEQLKQLKKAMLQQLFVDKNNKQPNSRFKNFKGNWEQHRLEEVAQVTMGQSPSSKNYTDNPNDYVLVQGNADLKSNKISPRVWTKEITKQVHKGEIIMTVRAPVGYLAMANMDAVIGRGVAAIDGNKYLYYLLQTKLMDRTWEKLSSGSTFESISSNDIKNLEIKVTETEEEKLITKLMNTVTYFVTLQKNNLTQLTTLKKYLLQNLFI
ncbi:restriction endonuclease subunit S [Limosilactobacillus reuteri]|uniref:restriction endonuclease subunit S n=2 Tax=Limosilactobacillus reuteri TaxID=1598 RepID=UPI000F2DDFFA|nr:restriction endonuclease subunit S [Limosilactobacillus reuteri]RNF37301.1 restriction endonuclease subunit S [Limosilactobacillus reuteri]